jgi:uncharacterized protein YbjT (DUF2867 family)
MHAVIIGATGLTGSHLLTQLLEMEQVAGVITLSRKRITNNHPKHAGYQVDLLNPATYSDHLKGSHLFICTGTTKAKTPDKAAYLRIEHELPVTVAKAAFEKGFSSVIAISALGANPQSKVLYNRGKGMMERDIAALGFKEYYFAQPALIGGNRAESRPLERFFVKLQRLLDPLLVGSLEKYRLIEPETIAAAMIYVAIHGYSSSRLENDTLKTIASNFFQNRKNQ